LWRAVVGGYELRPDELMTLKDVAHLSDMIVRLSEAWLAAGLPVDDEGFDRAAGYASADLGDSGASDVTEYVAASAWLA
jgi:hypothetical protein